MFAIAEQLAQKGKIDETIRVLKVVTQDKNADYRAEARARIARLLTKKGDLYGAAQWYRRLLDEKPNAAAVRIELAQILARLGDEPAAAAQLRRAQATAGLPPQVALALRRSVDYLRSTAPFSLDVSFGLAPDSNINAATNADSVTLFGLPFTLDKGGRQTSGIGATLSAQVTSRLRMGNSARWISQIGTYGNFYRASQFDDVSYFASTGPEFADRNGSIRPALTVGQRLYGADLLYNFYGGSITKLIRQESKGQFTISGSITELDYSLSRNYQTGITESGNLAYDRALNPTTTAHIGASASRVNARIAGYALTSATGELVLAHDFRPFTIYGRVSFARIWGDADYPPFAMPRDDKTYEGDAGVIFRRISVHGFSPQLKATYIRADSPISLFAYHRVRGEISLAASF